MKPLYAIASEIAALLEQTDEDGALLPDIEEKLNAVHLDLDAKIEQCLKAIRNIEGYAEVLRDESQRLAKRARVEDGHLLRLKNYVRFQLERIGMKSMKAGLLKVRIQRNSIASVTFAGDPSQLPPEFQRVKIELNAEAARDAVKEGRALPPGVRVETGTQLRIS